MQYLDNLVHKQYNVLDPHCGPFNEVTDKTSTAEDAVCRVHDIGYQRIQDAGRNPYFHYNEADAKLIKDMPHSVRGNFYRAVFQAKREYATRDVVTGPVSWVNTKDFSVFRQPMSRRKNSRKRYANPFAPTTKNPYKRRKLNGNPRKYALATTIQQAERKYCDFYGDNHWVGSSIEHVPFRSFNDVPSPGGVRTLWSTGLNTIKQGSGVMERLGSQVRISSIVLNYSVGKHSEVSIDPSAGHLMGDMLFTLWVVVDTQHNQHNMLPSEETIWSNPGEAGTLRSDAPRNKDNVQKIKILAHKEHVLKAEIGAYANNFSDGTINTQNFVMKYNGVRGQVVLKFPKPLVINYLRGAEYANSPSDFVENMILVYCNVERMNRYGENRAEVPEDENGVKLDVRARVNFTG